MFTETEPRPERDPYTSIEDLWKFIDAQKTPGPKRNPVHRASSNRVRKFAGRILQGPSAALRWVAHQVFSRLLRVLQSHPAIVRVLSRMVQASPLLKRLAAFAISSAGAPGGSLEETEPESVALLTRRLKIVRDAAPASPSGALRRMAYVSPLPPDRTGVADYSAELMPALAQHFEVVAVVPGDPAQVSAAPGAAEVISCDDMRTRAGDFDFVVYNIGNSRFHWEIFRLAEDVPGILLIHDVFIGDSIRHLEKVMGWRGYWTRTLIEEAGYPGLALEADDKTGLSAIRSVTASYSLARRSQAVIVTNTFAENLLGTRWEGAEIPVATVPLCLTKRDMVSQAEAREKLGIPQEAYLICTFGHINRAKRAEELIEAFAGFKEKSNAQALLHFVGGGDTFRCQGGGANVHVTGFASRESFAFYLAAADVAVQLRADTNGESSGATLDAMVASLPVILEPTGSMGELPNDKVIKLPFPFAKSDLEQALLDAYTNQDQTQAIGVTAGRWAADHHTPDQVAQQMHDALVRFDAAGHVVNDFGFLQNVMSPPAARHLEEPALIELSHQMVGGRALPRTEAQLLVDVSAIAVTDLRTGIQRVVRALIRELFAAPPKGYRIEPVRIKHTPKGWRMVYAREFGAAMLGIAMPDLPEAPVNSGAGDVYLMPDYYSQIGELDAGEIFSNLKRAGTRVYPLIHDNLPLDAPEFFPQEMGPLHCDWLRAVAGVADGFLSVSQATAASTRHWLEEMGCDRGLPIHATHLGADLEASAPTTGMPSDAGRVLAQLAERPTFLMVGTVEPRKGHAQVMDAFSQLWSSGVDANLVVVGAKGWGDDRHGIPAVIRNLRSHGETGKRLFWLSGISDEYLARVYDAADCLIAASWNEGFGLPLIEAAQKKLPILARDIPIFREVAGDHASFFTASDGSEMASALLRWLELFERGEHPVSDQMPWRTWSQTTQHILSVILDRSATDTPAR